MLRLSLNHILGLWLALASCGGDLGAPFDNFGDYESETFADSNIELFAGTSHVRVKSTKWNLGVEIRLLSSELRELTPWKKLDAPTHEYLELESGTTYWVTYRLNLDGKLKSGTLAIETSGLEPVGYILKTSVVAGEKLILYASSQTREVLVRLLKATTSESLTSWRLDHVKEHEHSRKAPSNGCAWPAATSITLPADLPSGYYYLSLSSNHGSSLIPFVVRPTKPGNHGLAIVASTNTWAAYNPWGNASFYHNRVSGPKLRWSAFDRPFGANVVASGHLIAGELELMRWLDANEIEYDVYDDFDLDQGRMDDKYNTWIFHVHSEYWTQDAAHRYSQHLEKGNKVIFLSGNNIWWDVSYTNNNRRLYKHGEHKNRATANYTGTLYTGTGYGTKAAYTCLLPEHWVFQGTGLRYGDSFGADGLFGGASGHETDKFLAGEKRTTLLAKGQNPDSGGADMVVFKALNGEVFNTSSITFNGALSVDPVVSRIVRNVIRRYNGQ